LRTGQFEATITYGNGITAAAQLRFELGDANRAARLYMRTDYTTPSGTETSERITIGNQTWQRRPPEPWARQPEQEGVWSQVQVFLPRAAAVSQATLAQAGESAALHWYDATRDAEVSLQVNPGSGLPRALHQVIRATKLQLDVIYSGWNTPVEINSPE
jgi:hypothetical protein